MNRRRIIVLLTIAAALPAGMCAQTPMGISGRVYERLSNPVKDGKVTVARVIVMPARATLNKEGMKGQEGMTKEGDELAAKLTREVEQLARAAGFEVIASPFSGQPSEERRGELLRLLSQYEEVHNQIDWNTDVKSPWGKFGAIRAGSRKMNEGRAKVTEDALLADSIAGADTLIFPRAAGSVKTGGLRAAGGLVGALEKSAVAYDLGFVSRQTGEVYALYFVSHTSSLEKQMKKPVFGNLQKRIQKALVQKARKKTKA